MHLACWSIFHQSSNDYYVSKSMYGITGVTRMNKVYPGSQKAYQPYKDLEIPFNKRRKSQYFSLL